MITWSLIVLAAGKGSRLGGAIPKPLVELGGKPLIQPILDNGLALPFKKVIVILSEYTQDVARRFPNPRLTYLIRQPKGTAYSVQEGLDLVETPQVLIAQADDSYFYTKLSLLRLMQAQETTKADFTVATAHLIHQLPYSPLLSDEKGRILSISLNLEGRNSPPPKDIVAGLYAAKSLWLCQVLPLVEPSWNGECGLPSVVPIGLDQSANLRSLALPPAEWHGINTPEELREAESYLSGP